MKVFLTGATGYIGSAIAESLQAAGHHVLGLARSEAAAEKLTAAGIESFPGDLTNGGALYRGASSCDAVIHTAMAWGPETAAVDEAAVRAILEAMLGSGKTFIYTSGVWVIGDTKGHVAGEMAPLRPPALVAWRPAVENLVRDAVEQKVRGVVIRPARVYGRGGGPVAAMVQEAKATGIVKIVGNGENHWSFVPLEGLAKLYVLAVEQSPAGEVFLAADGPAFKVREVAEATGAKVESIPIEVARQSMGPLADALALDQRIMSTKAGRMLGWNPRYPSVLEEVRRMMVEKPTS